VNGPPKETGALLHAPIPKLTAQFYDQQRAAQATVSWQGEAQRLLAEYTRTGEARHFVGIFERLTESKL
jgi:hypothetical protein